MMFGGTTMISSRANGLNVLAIAYDEEVKLIQLNM